jgi:DNA polymerase
MTLQEDTETETSTTPAPAPAPEETKETNLFGEHAAPPATVAREDDSPYARVAALIPETSPLRTIETLEEAERYVASTVLIPLDEIRTNPVFGVGNPHADLMVIGEAPGADEDRQGEPFVGRAGQLLTKILQAIGFEREDVYIANILKSRPPNNRNPLAAEVEAHIPILYKQIALIEPKILLCVGKTAGTSLLNRQTSLAKLRGTFHDYHGLPVLVTYHPAALLRNPHWKRPTWEDVQLLRTRYDELGGA